MGLDALLRGAGGRDVTARNVRSDSERIVQYVRLRDVDAYAACGWVLVDGDLRNLGHYHGRFTALMEYRGS